MIHVVLDTNVLVSAVIKTQGTEAAALDIATKRRAKLCVSEPIIREYAEVLRRPRLKLDAERVRWVLEFIRSEAVLTTPTARLHICPDEPDNRFLECADAAGADYLITGNRRHFPEQWKSTRIASAREFLEAVQGRE